MEPSLDARTAPAGALRDGRHVLPVRVYYEDTDFSGVVYHASYLRFMERGRTEYLRARGIDHRALFEGRDGAAATAFAVRSMQIEFLKAAHMDDVLEVWTEPLEVKGASGVLRQRIVRADTVLIDARVKFACVAGGKPQRIPEHLRSAMLADQAEAAARTDRASPR